MQLGYSWDIPGLGFPGITLGFEKTQVFPKTRGIPENNIENPGFEINTDFHILKGFKLTLTLKQAYNGYIEQRSRRETQYMDW